MRYFRCLIHLQRSKSFKSAGKTGLENHASYEEREGGERRRLPQGDARRCAGCARKLRKIIKAAAPKTTEVISYRIPIFKYYGRPLVGFGATENNCSFYVMSSSMIPKLGTRADC